MTPSMPLAFNIYNRGLRRETFENSGYDLIQIKSGKQIYKS